MKNCYVQIRYIRKANSKSNHTYIHTYLKCCIRLLFSLWVSMFNRIFSHKPRKIAIPSRITMVGIQFISAAILAIVGCTYCRWNLRRSRSRALPLCPTSVDAFVDNGTSVSAAKVLESNREQSRVRDSGYATANVLRNRWNRFPVEFWRR